MPRSATFLAAALLLAATAAQADHVEVHVSDAWSRATPPAAEVGAAYFTLMAHGSGADRLVGASTPVAARAELHTHVMQGSLMKMEKMEGVEVHPEAPIAFAPGGNHVMLMGLKAPLKEGDRFPLTLTFEKAGDVVVEVAVQGAGAMSAEGGDAHGSHSQMKAEGEQSPAMQHDHSHPGTKKD